MSKRGWSIDSLVLIFSFIVIAQLLSYAIPHGGYERAPAPGDASHTVVVAGTYEVFTGEQNLTLPPWHFLMAITDGLAKAQGINGQVVHEPQDLEKALRRGAEVIAGGEPYLLDVRVTPVGPGADSTWHQEFKLRR